MESLCSNCASQPLSQGEIDQLRALLKLLRSHADLIALRDLIQAERHLQTIQPRRHVGG